MAAEKLAFPSSTLKCNISHYYGLLHRPQTFEWYCVTTCVYSFC